MDNLRKIENYRYWIESNQEKIAHSNAMIKHLYDQINVKRDYIDSLEIENSEYRNNISALELIK